MDLFSTILLKLDIPTSELRSNILQDTLLILKKLSHVSEQLESYYDEILEKLWNHLNIGLIEFDDQLLCSTCFYSALSGFKKQEIYLDKILKIINTEYLLKEKQSEEKSNIYTAVSLSYGLFQSSYFTQQAKNYTIALENILTEIFNLFTLMAYEYSQYTFIIFKIMTSFKKVVGTQLHDCIFNDKNQIKLLNLINDNWENPITGVRNLNRCLFQILLTVVNKNFHDQILKEVNEFYWNKAKFLMLTEIIEQYNGDISDLVVGYKWTTGLFYSLHKPGLVSAGADMYYAILKNLRSTQNWTTLLLQNVKDILLGSSFKAIENFNNYWCLPTFKKFPSLVQELIKELKMFSFEDSKLKLYAMMGIIKQGNKLGLIEKKWKSLDDCTYEERLVLNSLDHFDASIRMFAFDVICVSQAKCLPSEVEFKVVLDFLHDNINSDCTILRLNMLNSLTFFLIRLHTTFLNTVKSDHTDYMDDLIFFCKNLQDFIIKSLNLNGNYQRKLTTIKLTCAVIKYLNEVPRKKQKQTKITNESLIGFLNKNGCWMLSSDKFIIKLISMLKDPANDVCENVFQLLLNYYKQELSSTYLLNKLIEEGLNCLQSKYFYEISCGRNIFQLIINIIYRQQNPQMRFKNIEDIFHFAFNDILLEYKNNIVDSIENGKQLHSFLSILKVIYEICIQNSYNLNISIDTVFTLLTVIENISDQFAWEELSSTSSDFAKMNDMVQNFIKKSAINAESKNDETKISGIHQIVLNCLWLNVKGSCDLASILIPYYKENNKICEKSLNIITHVLETSRHKGAIEAAGAALGQGIHFLTSLSDKYEVSKLPLSLLEKKLNELLCETNKMSSVTRRGAGLSIMVHRIVSNDMKKGKPLFHYFMKTLLQTCNKIQDSSMSDRALASENVKDLPKAIYIHFLTRIVTDSSLASDIMYYSAELAALAFGNLADPQWQIRNAALQLYGALIPKLIGQKKASGTDEETVATVGCDEFITHSPKLWKYIVQQIKGKNFPDMLQGHANLVPILNVLANVARRYSFSFDMNEQRSVDSDLLLNLLKLLGSPIHTVRRLTSKCISNMYSFEIIYEVIKYNDVNECKSENYLHGILMLISNCLKYYFHIEQYKNQLDNLRIKYDTSSCTNRSFLCKWTSEKIFEKMNPILSVELVKDILAIETQHRHCPGASIWVNMKIGQYLEQMPWEMVPQILNLLISSVEFEQYCNIINEKVQKNMDIPRDILLEIVNILLLSEENSRCPLLWETIYNISLLIDVNIEVNDRIVRNFLGIDVSYKTRYSIPFLTRVLVNNPNNSSLLSISKSIYSLCSPENNVDVRYSAALANNEIAQKFKNVPEAIKVNSIMSAVILLQDEDEDVRNISVSFHSTVIGLKDKKHPFVCLNRILEKIFLHTVLMEPESSTQIIVDNLLKFTATINLGKYDEYNPFANDSKNIYLEEPLLRHLLLNLTVQ